MTGFNLGRKMSSVRPRHDVAVHDQRDAKRLHDGYRAGLTDSWQVSVPSAQISPDGVRTTTGVDSRICTWRLRACVLPANVINNVVYGHTQYPRRDTMTVHATGSASSQTTEHGRTERRPQTFSPPRVLPPSLHPFSS